MKQQVKRSLKRYSLHLIVSSLIILSLIPVFFSFSNTYKRSNVLQERIEKNKAFSHTEFLIEELLDKEKEYLINPQMQTLKEIENYYHSLNKDRIIKDYNSNKKINFLIEQQYKNFIKIKSFQEEIGRENQGLIGKYRRFIHKVEDYINKNKLFEEKNLLLEIRRNEKDFLLRERLNYIESLKRNVSLLMEKLPSEKNNLSNYKDTFLIVSNKRKEITFLKNKLFSFKKELTQEIKKEKDLYNTYVELELNRIKDIDQLIIITEFFFILLNGAGLIILLHLFLKHYRRQKSLYKQLHRELELNKEMQEQIVIKEKLNSITAISIKLSHEILNPLNFIKNYNEMIPETLDKKEELLIFSEKIGENCDRIQKLLSSASKYGNISRNFQTINLQNFLEIYFQEFNASNLNLNTHLNLEIESTINRKIDKKIFIEMLNEIMENIKESVYRKKKFTENFIPTVLISIKYQDEELEMKFFDNGVGVKKEEEDKIFEPFFSTKENGSGLGLSLIRDAILLHKGSISVRSKENDCFETLIKIPLKES